jgi:hypothetical protein
MGLEKVFRLNHVYQKNHLSLAIKEFPRPLVVARFFEAGN